MRADEGVAFPNLDPTAPQPPNRCPQILPHLPPQWGPAPTAPPLTPPKPTPPPTPPQTPSPRKATTPTAAPKPAASNPRRFRPSPPQTAEVVAALSGIGRNRIVPEYSFLDLRVRSKRVKRGQTRLNGVEYGQMGPIEVNGGQ